MAGGGPILKMGSDPIFPRIFLLSPANCGGVRARMVAASEGGDESAAKQPIVRQGTEFGRNDVVTIRKGGETQTLKYKKAEPLLAEGWILEGKG